MNSSGCDLFWIPTCDSSNTAFFCKVDGVSSTDEKKEENIYLNVFRVRAEAGRRADYWRLTSQILTFVCNTLEISIRTNVLCLHGCSSNLWKKSSPDLVSIKPSPSSTFRHAETATDFILFLFFYILKALLRQNKSIKVSSHIHTHVFWQLFHSCLLILNAEDQVYIQRGAYISKDAWQITHDTNNTCVWPPPVRHKWEAKYDISRGFRDLFLCKVCWPILKQSAECKQALFLESRCRSIAWSQLAIWPSLHLASLFIVSLPVAASVAL